MNKKLEKIIVKYSYLSILFQAFCLLVGTVASIAILPFLLISRLIEAIIKFLKFDTKDTFLESHREVMYFISFIEEKYYNKFK